MNKLKYSAACILLVLVTACSAHKTKVIDVRTQEMPITVDALKTDMAAFLSESITKTLEKVLELLGN